MSNTTTITVPITSRAAVIAVIKEDLRIKVVNVIIPLDLGSGEGLVKD